MGKRSLSLAWGSAALREAAAMPPEGWNNINGLRDVSVMASPSDPALSIQRESDGGTRNGDKVYTFDVKVANKSFASGLARAREAARGQKCERL